VNRARRERGDRQSDRWRRVRDRGRVRERERRE